jgi:hypothetical protein
VLRASVSSCAARTSALAAAKSDSDMFWRFSISSRRYFPAVERDLIAVALAAVAETDFERPGSFAFSFSAPERSLAMASVDALYLGSV